MTSEELQERLTLKMMEKLEGLGSTLYSMTWKPQVTPARRLLFRVRASVRRTSGIDCIGEDSISPALLASWVSPAARDWKDSGADIKPRADGSERFDQLPRQANLAGWNTPRATDGSNGGPNQGGGALPPDAHLAGWPTTSCNNDRTGNPESALSMTRADGSKVQQRLQDFAAIASPARLTADGRMLIGSSAGMESGGQLNPAHSRWLMGYPVAWCQAAVSAWRLMPTKRQKRE